MARKPRNPNDPHQLSLFGEPAEPPPGAEPLTRRGVAPAAAAAEVVRLAAELPPELRLGTSSWSFPGWRGLVYDGEYSEGQLARHGLAAYAAHPLLRAVGIDRTYYRPLSAEELAGYAAVTPASFRFLVKSHDWVTSPWRDAAGASRTGGRRSLEENPCFLDAGYAVDAVVAPFVTGLGERGGPLVFQFPPLGRPWANEPGRFVDRLAAFLERLPRGPLYAVEVRNATFLTPAYAAALGNAGVLHCYNVHPRMPPPLEQAEVINPAAAKAFVARWMLNPMFDYAAAQAQYAPFDRLVDEDPQSRDQFAELCLLALGAGRPAYVIVNNKAEGAAPLSVQRLAERIVARRGWV